MAELDIQGEGEITFQPAEAGGDSFENDGNTQLIAIGPPTGFSVVFANGRDCEFGEHDPLTVTIDPGDVQLVSDRLSPSRFNDSASLVNFTYLPSAVGIQVAAVRSVVVLKDPVP